MNHKVHALLYEPVFHVDLYLGRCYAETLAPVPDVDPKDVVPQYFFHTLLDTHIICRNRVRRGGETMRAWAICVGAIEQDP